MEDVHRETLRRVSIWTASVLVPAVVLADCVRRISHLPATWAYYSDPTYPYLFNGLALTQGVAPGHTDHPGTSLQWLAAISEVLTWVLRTPDQPLRIAVINHPEDFLRSNGFVLVVIFCIALGFFGYQAIKQFGPAVGLTVELVVFASMGLWFPYVWLLTPESLVLTAGIFLLALLLPTLVNRNVQPSLAVVVGTGTCVAIGMTAKVIFLPIVLVLPFILRPKQLLQALVVSFLGATIILFPVRGSFPRMLTWFTSVASQPSRHGLGQNEEWTPLNNFLRALPLLSDSFVGLVPLIVLSGVCLLTTVALRRSTIQLKDLAPTVGIVTAVIVTLLFSYKAFELRDFILLGPLLAVLLGMAIRLLMEAVAHRDTEHLNEVLTHLPAVALGAALVLVVFSGAKLERSTGVLATAAESRVRAVEEARRAAGQSYIAFAYGVPSPENAILFGNSWANHIVSGEIARQYPALLELSLWDRALYGWTMGGQRTPLSCDEISRRIRDKGLYIVISERHLDEYFPRDSRGAIEISGGQRLDVEEKVRTSGTTSLVALQVKGCRPERA